MTCNCKQEDTTIEVTFGCSKELTFDFDSDLEGYTAQFCVRADLDTAPVLTKTISDLTGTSLTFELSTSDNSVFSFGSNEDVAQYIWGLDVYDETSRTPVFPQTGQMPPLFLVFKHVAGN